MLKGDLGTRPLRAVLDDLAAEGATGCLRLTDHAGEEALVYLKTGLVYAVSVPGRRPQLGARLVSSGALAPEALSEALAAQRDELQGWRLGELLVHLGFVEQEVVEAFVTEQLKDGMTDLLRWREARWRFRQHERTREDVAPPLPVAELLSAVVAREEEWAEILDQVHAPTAVPVLSTRGGASHDTILDGDAWSLLCKVDGERSVAELARDCGLTVLEAGRVVARLVTAGLVDVEEVAGSEPPRALVVVPPVESVDIGPEPDPAVEVGHRQHTTDGAGTLQRDEVAPVVALSGDQLSASIARVSAALSDLMGTGTDLRSADIFDAPPELRALTQATAGPSRTPNADEERRARLRAAAAAELAAAHAEAERQHRAAAARREQLADVVSLADRRAADDQARLEGERLEAERLAAEEAARLGAERLEAQQLEAERLAGEEAARLEAERLEAERLEAERLEAERLAAEEAARLEAAEAARLEAERLEAERLAAEEAARLEAERLEAQRLEAERLAAEEAARLEAERLEAERLQDEERRRAAAAFALELTSLTGAPPAEPAAPVAPLAQVPVEDTWPVQDDEVAVDGPPREATFAAAAALTAFTAESPFEAQHPSATAAYPASEPASALGVAAFDDGQTVRAWSAPPDEGNRTDTAALLRELSSLGLGDDAPAAPASRPAPPTRPAAAVPPPKKRKGFFGR